MAEESGKSPSTSKAYDTITRVMNQIEFDPDLRPIVDEAKISKDSDQFRYRVMADLHSDSLLRDLLDKIDKSNRTLTWILIVVAFLQVVVTAVGIYMTSK